MATEANEARGTAASAAAAIIPNARAMSEKKVMSV
jgi:hypothetical protein